MSTDGEGKFIHDIASPLCMAALVIENLLEDLKGGAELPSRDELIAQFSRVSQALAKATDLLQQRRKLVQQ